MVPQRIGMMIKHNNVPQRINENNKMGIRQAKEGVINYERGWRWEDNGLREYLTQTHTHQPISYCTEQKFSNLIRHWLQSRGSIRQERPQSCETLIFWAVKFWLKWFYGQKEWLMHTCFVGISLEISFDAYRKALWSLSSSHSHQQRWSHFLSQFN